ncbi:MAG: hypothetical protein DDT21_02694 [Syntrophomonadaceae bacterium]|nr:hypothetical protein [Bacillota bacterium]
MSQNIFAYADSLAAASKAARTAIQPAAVGIGDLHAATAQVAGSGEKAAKAQETLGDATEKAAKAANKNIMAFDQVHQLQEDMAGVGTAAGLTLPAATLPAVALPDIADIAIPGIQLPDVAAATGPLDELAKKWDGVIAAMKRATPVIEGLGGIIGTVLLIKLAKLIGKLGLLAITSLTTAKKNAADWAMKARAATTSATKQVAAFVTLKAKWLLLGIQATAAAAKAAAAWVLQKVQALASLAAQLPVFASLVVKWILLGVTATARAAKIAAAWVLQRIQALLSLAAQLPVFVTLIGKWILLGTRATTGAAKIAAAWVLQRTQALLSKAAQLPVFATLVGKWILLGATATARAAKIAAAWVIALGPVAWVLATVALVALVVARNWDKIKTKTRTVWEGIMSTIKNRVNSIIDSINRLIETLNKLPLINIPTIPRIAQQQGGKATGPIIPKLAKGGIITSPTLAMIGDAGPEAVLPLRRGTPDMGAIADAVGQAVYAAVRDAIKVTRAEQGGQGQQQEVVIEIDGARIGRAILPALIREGQRTGMPVIRLAEV